MAQYAVAEAEDFGLETVDQGTDSIRLPTQAAPDQGRFFGCHVANYPVLE
jgi:hypothetical protein